MSAGIRIEGSAHVSITDARIHGFDQPVILKNIGSANLTDNEATYDPDDASDLAPSPTHIPQHTLLIYGSVFTYYLEGLIHV